MRDLLDEISRRSGVPLEPLDSVEGMSPDEALAIADDQYDRDAMGVEDIQVIPARVARAGDIPDLDPGQELYVVRLAGFQQQVSGPITSEGSPAAGPVLNTVAVFVLPSTGFHSATFWDG